MAHRAVRRLRLRFASLCVALVAASSLSGAPPARAQLGAAEGPEAAQALGAGTALPGEPVLRSNGTIEFLSPVDEARGAAPPSPSLASPAPGRSLIEEDFSARAGSRLNQFGYEVFQNARLTGGLASGAVGEDYRLGISDEIVVTFVGRQNYTVRTRVDREGRVILPGMPPISAVGRSFGDFRADLEAQVTATLLGTKAFVSLGALRAVSVMVMGEVSQPGVYQLTGMSTLFDALVVAGGIKKTGSLRRIQVVRGDQIFWLDAYDLLFTGFSDRDVTVSDGDRIVVPTIGATVAVAGLVKRPGIYELAEGETAPTLARILNYAGGTVRPSGNRVLRIAADASGREQVHEEADLRAVSAANGDILVVELSQNIQKGSVFLDGHVRTPGLRSITSAPSVHALLPDLDAFQPDPYLLFAVLERTDERTRTRLYEPVDLYAVMARQGDAPLAPGDRLIVLARDDVRYLSSAEVQAVLAGRLSPGDLSVAQRAAPSGAESKAIEEVAGAIEVQEVTPRGGLCAGLAHLAELVAAGGGGRFPPPILRAGNEDKIVLEGAPCRPIFESDPDLLPFLLEHVATLSGQFRLPGFYPVMPETSLALLASTAGGFGENADLRGVELDRLVADGQSGVARVERKTVDVAAVGVNALALSPGDILRVDSVFVARESGPVLLSGEVVHPGLYEIRRGETLLQVIERAGGFTPQAFPYGAVFTRESARRAEKVAFDRAALELESALLSAMTRQGRGEALDIRSDAAVQLINSLRNVEPVGRVVIEADPTVLQVRPELDTILEPGDRLYIPKRPNSVTVSGEVLNPTALQFVPGASGDRYIEMAGGYRDSADEDRIFVLFPNGVAQPLEVSFWNYTPIQIPPGSTVVVPRDTAPIDALGLTSTVSGILSSLAITAASIAVISDR